jgi:drug/metabolite transporter (DMT)-like permease
MKTSVEGWSDGFIGVIIFSGSLPATRLAVSGFSPMFLTAARATVAALLSALLLAMLRQSRPARADLLSLLIVALGVVIGYPLLTALALQHVTSAHSIVFVGLLPLATAVFGVLRGGERPRALFWLFSIAGSLTVAAFALAKDASVSPQADLLMIAAIVVCGLGYAEGGRVARRLGGWQVICWALLLAAPPMLLLAILTSPTSWHGIGISAWLGLAYVSVFSMLVGFIFWYRGLALGGIARVGQLQLLQPFLGFALAGLLLHEPVAWTMVVTCAFVVLCVALARRYA